MHVMERIEKERGERDMHTLWKACDDHGTACGSRFSPTMQVTVNGTQVMGLDGKCVCLLGCLASP